MIKNYLILWALIGIPVFQILFNSVTITVNKKQFLALIIMCGPIIIGVFTAIYFYKKIRYGFKTSLFEHSTYVTLYYTCPSCENSWSSVMLITENHVNTCFKCNRDTVPHLTVQQKQEI